jgi:hypothetical protein
MSTPKRTQVLASAWLGAVLLWAPSSFASPAYPQIVAETLAMPCVPTCLLCHEDLQGGVGTIRGDVNGSSFGVQAIAAGVDEKAPATVGPALATIEMTSMPDTDGDGTKDIAELRVGADPNESGVGNVCGGGPTYGCGATIARERTVEPVALSAALGAALVLVLARRRRRPS